MPATQIVLGVLGAGALALTLLASGARVRRALKVPTWPSLRLPLDFLAGSWLFATVSLALGLFHLWGVASLIGAAVCLGALGRFRRTGWRWGPALPSAIAGLVVVPVAVVTPFFYDALVYHLGLPWQALQEGGLSAHPEDLFAAFPPVAQLVDAPLVAAGLDRSPALLHWFGFVAAGAALWGLARALGAPKWAALAAGACLPLLPCSALVPGLPAAEAWCLGGEIAAFALVAHRTWRPGTEALIGLSAGVAAAARMQGVPWALVVLAAVLARTRRVRPLLVAAGGVLLGSAPWWVKNLVLLRDPLAPLSWRREGVETLWRDAGSALHLARNITELIRMAAVALVPHAAYLAVLLLAALLATTVRARASDRIVALAAVTGVGVWGLTGNLPRFLTVSAALLVGLAAGAGGRSSAGRWVSTAALGVTLALGLAVSLSETVRWRALAAAFEPTTVARAELVVNDPFPAFGAARTLPGDARVLFVGEPRGFGFPRRFVAPSQHDVSPLRGVLEASRAPADACAELRRQGFTHLLVNWGELARLTGGYPVAPWRDPAGWRRWTVFVASLGPPVVDVKGVQVFLLPEQTRPGV
ncbi:MAG TPA: hypothetical protein VMT19_11605 [Thermoanaerobaculaceae bacterium]|nr:hypothetical protein [Thermoanaerobaculaceae bacterium]